MTDRKIRMPSVVALLIVAALVFSLDLLGAFRWAENMVAEARMAFAPRDASGDVVFIGIDNRSLDAIGVWPWPRETYADIARRLVELGAGEIFFDVDLSAPSNASSDDVLTATLAELGGAIILPAFRQAEGLGAASDAMSDNLPLPAFREHAWLASVNVATDRDGRVRRYPYGQIIAGEEVPSVASMLSGTFGAAETDFAVNFAITPSSVPSYPVIDLLGGEVTSTMIEGRSVVVGAHALELRDNLPVPVHGIVPGPLLQILAAETLIQRRRTCSGSQAAPVSRCGGAGFHDRNLETPAPAALVVRSVHGHWGFDRSCRFRSADSRRGGGADADPSRDAHGAGTDRPDQ